MAGERLTGISILLLFGALLGCAARQPLGAGPDVVFVLPGVAGDGATYNGLLRALRDEQLGQVHVVRWGAPAALFFINFSDRSTHDRAERQLADRIDAWLSAEPGARVYLIGHSAGCGVILGALARLDTAKRVSEVVLLAPSVSPEFDLRPALARIDGTLHVFYSERDRFFLKWRTGNFGTYDRVRSPAAGHLGFDLSTLDEHERDRIVQHAHDPAWKALGNAGGHFGALSQRFARAHVIPLLRTMQSFEANPR